MLGTTQTWDMIKQQCGIVAPIAGLDPWRRDGTHFGRVWLNLSGVAPCNTGMGKCMSVAGADSALRAALVWLGADLPVAVYRPGCAGESSSRSHC